MVLTNKLLKLNHQNTAFDSLIAVLIKYYSMYKINGTRTGTTSQTHCYLLNTPMVK